MPYRMWVSGQVPEYRRLLAGKHVMQRGDTPIARMHEGEGIGCDFGSPRGPHLCERGRHIGQFGA